MSSKRLSLSDQAKELQDELSVPKIALQSRTNGPAVAVAPPPAVEPASVEVGGEGQSPVSPVVTIAEPEPEVVLPTTDTPTPRPRRSASAGQKPRIARTPEDLEREQKDLVPLGTMIPRRVRTELNRFVYSMRAEGKVYTMQDIVSMALVHFLRIEDI